MKTLITVLTAVSLTFGVLGTAYGVYATRVEAARAKQAHEDDERRERERDRNHLRTLEKIIASEFPRWTPAIDWDNK
jgi:hypothetical protein